MKFNIMCLSGKQKGDTMNGRQTHAVNDKQGVIREGFNYNR